MIGITPESKSWVASRFTLVDEAGTSKRRCRYLDCGKEYSRGTSHMILKRHWSRQHSDHFSDPAVSLRQSANNDRGNDRKPTKKKPLNSNNLGAGGAAGGCIKKDKNQNNTNANNATKPSIHEKQQFDVKLVAKRLKEAASIHLTFDIYTPKKGGKTYGIITAHSLGDSSEIKSVLLEYRHLPYPDDSTTLYEFLRSCITKFNIKEKIVSVASNFSNTVVSAIQEMDKRLRLCKNFNFTTVHIKCFPQFIHLNVLEVLRSQEGLVENVRKVVGFINTNHFTLRPLQATDPNVPGGAVADNNTSTIDNNETSGNLDMGAKATGLKLPYDNRSSWNTTFNMIETFIQQRGFIEPTLMYFQNPQDSANINIDWDKLFTLIQLLKPFHDVVNKFALDNYTPVSLVAAVIPHLMDHLSSSSWAYDDLVMAAHNFKLQLESYRQLFQNDLTVIAGLLDPRIKDTFISPEGRDDAIGMLRKRLDSSPQAKNETQAHHSANSLWSQLFRPVNEDEVVDYLERPREPGCMNCASYWEANKFVYPCLYALAKTLACVQATSVPSDRMFSAAENADRERKIQLESTNSKELMKSWAKYLEK